MNKVELLADLAAHYTEVGIPKEAYSATETKEEIEAEGVKLYQVAVYEETGNIGDRKAVYFYVRDEGEATEEAFYRGNSAPYVVSSRPYRVEVEALVQSKIDSGEFLRGIVRECYEEHMFAVVKAYILKAGTVEEKRYFVCKDGETNNFYPATLIVD